MMLWSQVKKRRCAQCYSPMTMKKIDGEWEIICPNECQPGGHVSEAYVEIQQAKDSLDKGKVSQNYPELDPDRMTDEEIENAKDALW